MCSACEDDEVPARQQADPEIILRARRIEAEMEGGRVPAHAWDIFFGLAGGAIEWAHYQRIALSYAHAERMAASAAPHLRLKRPRSRSIPVCSEA